MALSMYQNSPARLIIPQTKGTKELDPVLVLRPPFPYHKNKENLGRAEKLSKKRKKKKKSRRT